MIIHKLIAHHLKHRDDPYFYTLQARDAIAWMEKRGVRLSPQSRVLDLGCGHGILGGELLKRGCQVTFADESLGLLPEMAGQPFHRINLDRDKITDLGQYDLVACSNVLEHLAKPAQFIHTAHEILTPGGWLYLSWTNWLSPWGGHEFSPFHYLGARRGHLVYDRIVGRKRIHTPFVDLYPTFVGRTLRFIRRNTHLQTVAVVPRYYSEFGFLMRIPLLREFLAWNCAMLLRRV